MNIRVEIIKTNRIELQALSHRDVWVEVSVFSVNVYKGGDMLYNKIFKEDEKDKAGLYAFGIEQFYKFYKEK